MHILGLMAQKKTGMTYAQIFSSVIKQPLGLTVSNFPGNNARPSSSLNTNVIEYEKILRSIFMKTILPPDVIDMMEQDQTNVSITISPATEYNVGWHYALGHWVECPYEDWNPSCLTDLHRRSSPGALGFYPWVDRKMNYYGILATYQSKGIYSALQVDTVRDEIHAALASMNPTPVAGPAGSSSPSSSNTPSGPSTSPSSVTAGSSHVFAMTLLSFGLLGITLLFN
jgi:hypothetical protein